MLLETTEPQNCSEGFARELFDEFADVVDGHMELLSLAKFAAMAAKYQLFSVRAQTGLAGRSLNDSFETELELVRSVYPNMRAVIQERLTKGLQYNELWDSRLNEYHNRLHGNEYTPKCICLIYSISSVAHLPHPLSLLQSHNATG